MRSELVDTPTALRMLGLRRNSTSILHRYRRAGLVRGHKRGTTAQARWSWNRGDLEQLIDDPPSDISRLLEKAG